MAQRTNVRKKHLDAISRKIACFYLVETYAEDDDEMRAKLTSAIQLLDEAAAQCVANDAHRRPLFLERLFHPPLARREYDDEVID